MVFSSTIFLFGFLPAMLVVYYLLLRGRTSRNTALLAGSLFFYAWGEPRFVWIMILSILVHWIFGIAIEKNRDRKIPLRILLCVILAFNIALLFVFKYLFFTASNINAVLGDDYLIVPRIALPIGISFFTFQSISYVLDILRGGVNAQRNPLSVGLYIALFPQLVAGPIVRYASIAEQIDKRRENFDDFSHGVCRFIGGFAKKLLLANTFAEMADMAFSTPSSQLTVTLAWLGSLSYGFQIYYDFSGYSDMAIGLGKMFGFHFDENFRHPLSAVSVSDFWRRWHISLGSWFRDYIYIPMGGSRVDSKSRLVFNLFIVWALTGIWHGANWTFFFWGIHFFVFLTIEKLTGIDTTLKNGYPGILSFLLRHGYVLLVYFIGMTIFRAENISQALAFLQTMFFMSGAPLDDGIAGTYLRETAVYWGGAILFSMPVAEYFGKRLATVKVLSLAHPAAFTLLFVLTISYLIKGGHNPFIYFNF